MTPALFDGLDAHSEYELVQDPEGRKRLRRHHAQFITEADFAWLAKHGVEILRLPVGHWVFGDQPHYIGAIERLDWAFAMAEKYELHILLDLHGAPGAQNAADHSGSGRPGLPDWLRDPHKRAATINSLERLALRYRDNTQLWGLELLNEPAVDATGLRLAWFYRRAYRRVVRVARPGTHIIFSDGFKPRLLAGALLFAKKGFPTLMDCHFYQCFGEENKTLSFRQHLQKTDRIGRFVRRLSMVQPIIVGEWSLVLPFSLSDTQAKEFWQAQQKAYGPAKATFYWNYKTGGTSRWNFRRLVEDGLVVLK